MACTLMGEKTIRSFFVRSG